MSGPDEELVIFPRTTTVITVAATMLMLLVGSVLVVAFAEALRVSRWEYLFFAYVGVPFFALGLVCMVCWWSRRRPLLVVSRAGIMENVTPLHAGLLRWEDIAEVFVSKLFGQRFLRIVPHDLDALLARRPRATRLLVKLNYGLLRTPINISEKLLPMPIDVLLAEINRYRRA